MNFRTLMTSRYFAPIFWTQFLGAFNDNIFKNALIILFTYQSTVYTDISAKLLIPLSAGIFILPFFLFSALAGQLADKYEKSKLIRLIKLLEVIIMLLAAVGFYYESIWFLLAILFLMGCQSSLFGPVKYSILPQHLNEEGLMKGNGLFGMGTFMAILLGTILGGVLVTLDDNGVYYISLVVVSVAIAGWLSSQKIPPAYSAYQKNVNQNLTINWNIFTASRNIFKRLTDNRLLIGTILSISWFWFLGATILTILPGFTKNVLNGNELVVTLLLAFFTIGIGTGAIIVGRTGVLKKSIKWIAFGSMGISLFSAHLYWNSLHLESIPDSVILFGWQSMFDNIWTLMILLDVVLLGLSGGFYIVPLYVTLQEFSEIKTRSRIIAANNITNAFFMVCSAIIVLLLLSNDVLSDTLFLLLSISNLLVAGVLFSRFSNEISHLKNS